MTPLQPRRTQWLLYAILGLGFLIALTVLINQVDPQAREARELAAFRSEQISGDLYSLDLFVAAAWRIIPLILLCFATSTAGVIAYRRWGSQENIGAGYRVRELEAIHRPGQTPQSLTYSPHLIQRPQASAPALLTAPNDQDEAEAEDAPSFSTLLRSEDIGPGKPLILGYHQGDPITGDWRSLYSSGLGGLQGSGKTWTAAYLLAQSTLAGARLIICDPHAADEESLAARIAPLEAAFLCDIAEDERAILHALRLADAELRRRKAGHRDRTPMIVAVDEWNSLRRGPVAELLPNIIEDFSTEGRKLNCHVMLLGQRWDKASVGDFRNTLASSYIHRMRPDEARMMTGLRANALPDDTLRLPPGTAYLLDTRGELTRVEIPHITPQDIRQVGRQLANTGPFQFINQGSNKPEINRFETGNKPPRETEKTAAERSIYDPETERILKAFKNGESIGDIVKNLWPEARSGSPYNERRAQVEQTIRSLLAA